MKYVYRLLLAIFHCLWIPLFFIVVSLVNFFIFLWHLDFKHFFNYENMFILPINDEFFCEYEYYYKTPIDTLLNRRTYENKRESYIERLFKEYGDEQETG